VISIIWGVASSKSITLTIEGKKIPQKVNFLGPKSDKFVPNKSWFELWMVSLGFFPLLFWEKYLGSNNPFQKFIGHGIFS
jgi:hypothetical protein